MPHGPFDNEMRVLCDITEMVNLGNFARVAQWIEHWSSEPGVVGSNPTAGTTNL